MFDTVGGGSAPSPGPADAGLLADLEADFDDVREEDYADDPDVVGWPPYDDTGVLHDIIADQDRQIARTRALLTAAIVDRDDTRARLQTARARTAAAQDATDAAHTQTRLARHQLGLARAETARLAGERDLARADRDTARAARPDPGPTLTARLDAAPGPDLAAAVDTLVGDLAITPGSGPTARLGYLDGLSDDDVVALTVAAQRLAAWASAAQLAAAGHLRDRWAATPLSGNDHALWTTAGEIAPATGLTRYAVADHLHTAEHLRTRMPRVWTLLATGRIDLAKTILTTVKTLTLTAETCRHIEDGLLDTISSLTRPQLAALLDKLIAAADPDLAEQTARQARAHRGVAFRALPHGMGQMTLTTGAEDIEAARAALNTLTHTARGRGHLDDPDNPHAPCDPDSRHPDATRADTLIDLITTAADNTGTPTPAAAHADTDTPRDSAPGDDAPATAGRPSGRRRADIIVLVPLSVLTGQSQTPATLAGYGPIPAQLARELAATGTWRCAATDDTTTPDGTPTPTHGTLLGLGRSTHTPAYHPGPGLRRFIELRDQTCTFPGCRHPATRADLDHRTPWTDTPENEPNPGVTCDCNLHALCPHHHRLKHRGGLTARPTPGGGTTWTTPTGRTYTRRPDPLA